MYKMQETKTCMVHLIDSSKTKIENMISIMIKFWDCVRHVIFVLSTIAADQGGHHFLLYLVSQYFKVEQKLLEYQTYLILPLIVDGDENSKDDDNYEQQQEHNITLPMTLIYSTLKDILQGDAGFILSQIIGKDAKTVKVTVIVPKPGAMA